MKLLSALRNAAQRLAADFEDSKLFQHSGDKGEFREQIIGRFLRPFLPECYGIGSGEVFSADGASSKQIDLVIYDTIFSNVLFREANNSLFPCESVYGTVEVKSYLSTSELITSIENVASVKKLARTPSDMMDITPLRRIDIAPSLSAIITYSHLKRNPYLGIIFAYDSVTAQTAINTLYFNYLARPEFPNDHLPDFIFSYRQGYAIMKAKKQEDGSDRLAKLGEDFDDYTVLKTEEDTLPLFFLTLNICLNQTLLKVPNFHLYWSRVVKEALQRK